MVAEETSNSSGAEANQEECVNPVSGGYMKVSDGFLTIQITNKDVWDDVTAGIKNSSKDKSFMIKFQNDVDLSEENIAEQDSGRDKECHTSTSDRAESKDNRADSDLRNKSSFNVKINSIDVMEEGLAEQCNPEPKAETQIRSRNGSYLPGVSPGKITEQEDIATSEETDYHSERFGSYVFEGLARDSICVAEENIPANEISKVRKAMILIFCFLMQCCTGLLYSLGIIYVILLDVFGAGRSVTSLVQSLCLAVTYGLGFFIGMVIEKFGLRYSILGGSIFATVGFAASGFAENIYYIIALVGIIGGIGVSLITISSFAAIPIYFKDKQNAAVAFTSMGTGVGSVVWPLIMTKFVEEYNWRGNYILVGGIIFNACVMAMFFKSQKLSAEQKAIAKVNRSMKTIKRHFKEMVKNPRFLAFLLWSSFDSFSISVLSQMLVDFGLQLGYGKTDSRNLLIAYLMCNAIARFLVGVINRFKIPHFTLFALFCYMCGASFIGLSYTSTYTLSLALGMTSGFTLGLHVAMSMVILLKIVGPEKYGLGWGLTATCLGIGFSCSGPFAGMIADMYSYNMSFFISGIFVITITTFFSLVVFCTRNK
ncbi:monocarboxylate transporter 4-like isoform X1 [Argonauta hians]